MAEVSIKVAMRCRHFAGGDSKVDKRLGVFMDQPSLRSGQEEGTVLTPAHTPPMQWHVKCRDDRNR